MGGRFRKELERFFDPSKESTDWVILRKRTIEMSASVLIIDADSVASERLQNILATHGYNTAVTSSTADALAAFDHTSWPLVISAFAPSDTGEPALVQAILDLAPDTAVIVVGDREQATALAAL